MICNLIHSRKSKELVFSAVLWLSLAGCSQKSTNDYLIEAKAALAKGDTKVSAIEIRNALQIDPNHGEARLLLGKMLFDEGNNPGAEVELRKALAAGQSPNEVVPMLAKSLVGQGQAKRLIDDYQATELSDAEAQASLQTSLSIAYAAIGKVELSKAALNNAFAARIDHPAALLVKARQQASDRDYASALATVSQVLKKEPNSAEAWKLKGDLVLFSGGNAVDAEDAYRTAIKFKTNFAPAYHALFTLLALGGRVGKAEEVVNQLKGFAPKNQNTQFLAAQLAYLKKDFKSAGELTRQLVTASPKHAGVLQLAGATEFQLGLFDQAEQHLEAALRLAPGLGFARRFLMMTHLRKGQAAKALKLYDANPADQPPDAQMVAVAGEAYLQVGDAARAEQQFLALLKRDPKNLASQTALAVTQLAAGKADTGIAALEQIAVIDKGASADLALISAHLRRSEFDKALAATNRLGSKPDKLALAQSLKGRIYLAKKDRPNARKYFEQALAQQPENFTAASSLSAMDVQDGKPADAAKRFDALLAKQPGHLQALLALASLTARNAGKPEEVLAYLSKAIDANRDDVGARLALVNHHLNNGNGKSALEAAQSAAMAIPDNPQLLSALADVQARQGQSNQAVSTLKKLIGVAPEAAGAYLQLAYINLQERDFLGAEQQLRKAQEIRSDSREVLEAWLRLAMTSKSYGAATRVAKELQLKDPKSAMGYLMEGELLVQQQNWNGAAEVFRQALKATGANEFAPRVHAALLQAGKPAEASTFAAGWTNEHPKDATFRFALGDMYLIKNSLDDAESWFRKGLAIQPENVIGHNNLAWLLAKQGKLPEALQHAERANALQPNQPAFMDTLAFVKVEMKEYATAVSLLSRALALQPDNHQLRLSRARVNLRIGNTAEGKADLERLKKLGDRFKSQREVEQLLNGT